MVGEGETVTLYVHELAHTGVVRNTLAIAAALRDGGQRVQIVTGLPRGEAPQGVEHVSLLRGPMAWRRLEQLAVVPRLREFLKSRRPAVLISTGNHGHAAAWAAAKGLVGLKRVYRISNDLTRDMPGAPRSGPLKRFVRRRFASRLASDADALVLVSPSLLSDPVLASAHAARKAVVIRNGVDVAEARNRAAGQSPHPWLEGGDPVVIAIGRLAPQKNFPTLLRAVAQVNQARAVRLIILGESRDRSRAELQAQADALGIGERLLLPGTTDNVFAWLARADLFVLPSWWEGSPNVLLEAIAVRVPVAASRTAGNAAEIIGTDYGRLFDPADVGEMAAAISAQIDPATRIEPGDRASDYDLDATLSRWRTFVDGVLRQGARA